MIERTTIYLADLAHTHSVGDQALMVPLGIGYIKAYAHQALGDAVDITLFKHPERLLAACTQKAPDILGFANYGWNENLNRAIGRHLRAKFPQTLIVAGGPNIDPEANRRSEFLARHDYVDFLCIDGGEEPFAELIAWHHEGSNDRGQLPRNLVWLDNGALRTSPERPLKKIIENLPSPYLSGYLDEFLAAGMVPLFETNRGCPFRCTFCAWGSASKDLVRRIDLHQALAEIAYVGERASADNWIVCDANFGILERDIQLAHAIRKVRDTHGRPKKCHIWLAKNVTERNLQVGGILGDMIVPVMAVQSMDETVLEHIKRDNISIDTYEEYQRKFHKMGSRTYSDLIVPLPGETMQSHLAALRKLIELGVDIIQSHNMRLLSGAETNSRDTRERFAFKTRYRLIHGDAGIYRSPDGTEVRAFEYEESLRSTSTLPESDLFYLRKLHFLVDFCWNIEVYKPLLTLGLAFGISPIDVLQRLLERAEDGALGRLQAFFATFDERSHDEWFDSEADIEGYFAEPANFKRLLNQEFEKLNIQFAVIALRDYKHAFDAGIAQVLRGFDAVPEDVLAACEGFAFALYPQLDTAADDVIIDVPVNLPDFDRATAKSFRPSADLDRIRLVETDARRNLRRIIAQAQGSTLSKILNTQGFALRDLKLTVQASRNYDKAFRNAV